MCNTKSRNNKEVLARPRGLSGNTRWDVRNHLDLYTEEERSKRLTTFFKFVFVRELLQRLLSAYKDRLIKHSSTTAEERQEIVQALRPQDFEPERKNFVRFQEFIQYFSDNKTRNAHWQQYEKLCHPCVINYDFIGHLETLEEDASFLLKMAGVKGNFLPIHNSTGPSEVLQYYSQVPTDYITRIGEQYRSDFEMFDYEYLGPVKELLERAKKASS